MSTQGAFDNSTGAPWSRGCASGTGRWTPVELIAMVLGFMVFWPIGLAVLAFKYWQRKTGGADLQTVAAGAFNNVRSTVSGFQSQTQRSWGPAPWARGFTSATGNAAFDEWKSAELSRLEAERRKLEDAHKEFADWLDTVRKAKDREEFDRFMNDRRGKSA
jgi:hypothetical protein